MKKYLKLTSVFLSLLLLIASLCSCSQKREKIVDVISTASSVFINGEQNETVEASMGAFKGKQGDSIEFRFGEPQEFNTFFITEKTATVRQFNIFAEIDGEFQLIYTGKLITAENITFETVTATAFKFTVVNTEIGQNEFIIQSISAYNIEQSAEQR